jgi:hypothetical protein
MAANLSITATDVAAVKIIEQDTAPAHEAIDAGEVLYYVAATGKVGLADQDEAAPLNDPVGIAIKTANQAGISVTFVRKGLLDLGDALAGLNFGAVVYLSATAGKIYDSDPGNAIVIGTVVPGWGYATADKLLRVDL